RACLDANVRMDRLGVRARLCRHDRTVVVLGVDGALGAGRLAAGRAGAGREGPGVPAPGADERPATADQLLVAAGPRAQLRQATAARTAQAAVFRALAG